MKNVLSIDLEDWDQLVYRRITGQMAPSSSHVGRQLDALLGVLNEAGVKATFFTLGMFAEQQPHFVKMLSSEGHEIACHGYAHLLVHRLSRLQFAEDTRRAQSILQDITGKPVAGYRAAEFSISSGSLWALEVLAELGFTYDSSIYPITHRRYGIPSFDPRPRRYTLPNQMNLAELPLAISRWGRIRLPVAGGGYFRWLPWWLLRLALQRIQRLGMPLITYFHPYEFDPLPLDVFRVAPVSNARARLAAHRFNFHQNIGRAGMVKKMGALLRDFNFGTFQEFLNVTDLGPNQSLLPRPGAPV